MKNNTPYIIVGFKKTKTFSNRASFLSFKSTLKDACRECVSSKKFWTKFNIVSFNNICFGYGLCCGLTKNAIYMLHLAKPFWKKWLPNITFCCIRILFFNLIYCDVALCYVNLCINLVWTYISKYYFFNGLKLPKFSKIVLLSCHVLHIKSRNYRISVSHEIRL